MSLLNRIAEGVWEVSRPLLMPALKMEHRMTVIRLGSGELWIHSPVGYEPEIAAELRQAGKPVHFVAPSRFHDMDWPEWFQQFPDASFYCPPGMMADHPELPFKRMLEPGKSEAWEDQIEKLAVQGIPKLNELVFLHRASRTLIVADLIFNLSSEQQNLIGKLALRMIGLGKGPGCSRLFRVLVEDRRALGQSVTEILEWDFERLIPGHGPVIESGAKAALRNAFTWLLPR